LAILEHAVMQAVTLVPPAWILAIVLAFLNVFVFHIVLAQEGHSAFYFIPFGILGFAVGNFLGAAVGLPLPMLGDVHVVEASLGAWALLTVANTRRVST
jgi:hypothetical protein